MNYQELLDIFAQPSQIEQYEFEIIKSIAVYSSQPNKSTMFRDLVLRVLEHRARFTKTSDIIESLTRNAGLFPYLNQEKLDFKDSIAYEFHRPLNMEGTYVFHEKQNEIYHRLLSGESIILSAPTSFGKSLIIDAMIATEKFDNIMVVVPTLALIDETRRRLSKFSDRYKIITQLSQVSIKRNVFVFTQERVNAYDDLPNIDFFVIDEFYKINSLEGDNSRTVALNLAFQKLHEMGGQFYLLGPCIEKIP
ncbi:MAG: DEAD/DEAH box helicase, partial [Calditrichaeota bacterium]|nr:DEAD/DEAH box helicase [Calditrichota bacterium]